MAIDNEALEELLEQVKKENEDKGIKVETRDLRLMLSDQLNSVGEGLD